MRTLSILTLAFALLTGAADNAYAQLDSVWSKAYGNVMGETAWCAVEPADGGLLVGGVTYGEANRWDLALMRLDANGDSLWYKIAYDGDNDDFVYSMLPSPGGGYYLCGTTFTPALGRTQSLIVAVDGNGDRLWSRAFSDYETYTPALVMDEDSCYYLLGCSALPTGGMYNQFDATIVKLSPQGDTLWTKYAGSDIDDFIRDGIRTSDGGFALVGERYEVIEDTLRPDALLMKFDRNANLEWSKIYGQPRIYESIERIVEFPNGNFALGGQYYCLEQRYGDGICLIVSHEGDSLSYTTIGTWGPDYVRGIVATEDGSAICSGAYGSRDMNYQFWAVSISGVGEVQWERTYGGNSLDLGWKSMWLKDGSLLLMGETMSFGHTDDVYFDAWLLKAASQNSVKPWTPEIKPPRKIELLSCYPAPFNSSTVVSYSTPFSGEVRATLVDLGGRELTKWTGLQAGQGRIAVDGAGLATGEYWLRVEQNGKSAATRLVLVR